MAYHTHLAFTNEALQAANFNTKSKTHLFRGSGVRMAEAANADFAQIRRAGRWQNTSMECSYLTNLPREVLRAHAGFQAKGGTFHLARDVTIDPVLERAMFPEVEARIAEIGSASERGSTHGFLQLLPLVTESFTARSRIDIVGRTERPHSTTSCQ